MTNPLLVTNESGLYCAAGDFYIDPWRPVPRAVITHGHSDHARWGHEAYLATDSSRYILYKRLGPDINLQTLPYGQAITINGVRVSFHPAGHILGSAQVRVADRQQVWVVSGDYKTEPDRTCAPFELVSCDVFVTESTFGLPIYKWRAEQEIFAEINSWWQTNRAEGRASILYAYALGKAQRLLAGVNPEIGPLLVHGAVAAINETYTETGIVLPQTQPATAYKDNDFAKALIVAPPSADGTPWLRRFGDVSTGFASGWMQVRGARRRRNVDRGFVLSDHVDWPGMLAAIAATGAGEVYVTHGYVPQVVSYLNEKGLQAHPLHTKYEGELDNQAENNAQDEAPNTLVGKEPVTNGSEETQ